MVGRCILLGSLFTWKDVIVFQGHPQWARTAERVQAAKMSDDKNAFIVDPSPLSNW